MTRNSWQGITPNTLIDLPLDSLLQGIHLLLRKIYIYKTSHKKEIRRVPKLDWSHDINLVFALLCFKNCGVMQVTPLTPNSGVAGWVKLANSPS